MSEEKKVTERTAVKMEDGSTVEFAGNRQVSKSVEVNPQSGEVTVKFAFRNGALRQISAGGLSREVQLRALGHGLSQKIGDNFAGVKELDDIVLATDDMMKQLSGGDWGAVREAGDSLAGASIVIRAICEATGKSISDVRAFLDGKLEAAKARGEKLTRQALYASFRNPASKTGAIIKRMEEEKASKSNAVNADDLLAEM